MLLLKWIAAMYRDPIYREAILPAIRAGVVKAREESAWS
jgi:hypothetical protein